MVGEVAQAVGAADRLCGLLKVDVKILPNDQDGASKPVTPVAGDIGHVVFDHVSFRYGDLGGSNTSQPVLRDVSFEALPGKTVALVGPSGAGKSTVLQLLMRFYDAESGDVLVDGKKVAAIDPVALRQKMALVPQDVAILPPAYATMSLLPVLMPARTIFKLPWPQPMRPRSFTACRTASTPCLASAG